MVGMGKAEEQKQAVFGGRGGVSTESALRCLLVKRLMSKFIFIDFICNILLNYLQLKD